jgi:hypothetical protein
VNISKKNKNKDDSPLEQLIDWLEEEFDAKLQQINNMIEKVDINIII